jgi:O-antigen ligase
LPGAGRSQALPAIFAGLFGVFLGVALLKFGNPPITEKYNSAPADVYEFLLGYPWPIGWAYAALGIVAVLGLLAARWELNAPRWLVWLPLAWFAWQIAAGFVTMDAALSAATLWHFAGCLACFYLGLLSLSRVERAGFFWRGLLFGFFIMLAIGWEQHFGGLEETRRYFYLYQYSNLPQIPPEYLKRISSNRIFATLFYPNALAGALLLLLPVTLALIWRARARLTAPARLFLLGAAGVGGLGCLYWSGSKGGWLLMLLLGLVALLRLRIGRKVRMVLIGCVVVAGLAGFLYKHIGFFQKGATSVSARFDYWEAAAKTAVARPLFGTGPGTFAIPYAQLKRPESEMARLVHNDYLEQASDSGIPGFLLYSIFIVGALIWAGRRCFPLGEENDWLAFSIWLGVLGWALQGLVEFGLYLPALAWPAFAFLGWLLGRQSRKKIAL